MKLQSLVWSYLYVKCEDRWWFMDWNCRPENKHVHIILMDVDETTCGVEDWWTKQYSGMEDGWMDKTIQWSGRWMDKTIQWIEIAPMFATMDLSKEKNEETWRWNRYTRNHFCIGRWTKQYSGMKLHCSLQWRVCHLDDWRNMEDNNVRMEVIHQKHFHIGGWMDETNCSDGSVGCEY